MAAPEHDRQQIPGALGVPKPDGDRVLVVTYRALEEFAKNPNWTAPVFARSVAAVMLIGGRRRPRIPISVLAVIAATLVTQLAGLDAAKPIGNLPTGLPTPSLSFLAPGSLTSLLAPAVAVAALAALESLLSASVADGMTVGQKHDPDRELFGQGLANIAAPLRRQTAGARWFTARQRLPPTGARRIDDVYGIGVSSGSTSGT